jgi:hypothetical protein
MISSSGKGIATAYHKLGLVICGSVVSCGLPAGESDDHHVMPKRKLINYANVLVVPPLWLSDSLIAVLKHFSIRIAFP